MRWVESMRREDVAAGIRGSRLKRSSREVYGGSCEETRDFEHFAEAPVAHGQVVLHVAQSIGYQRSLNVANDLIEAEMPSALPSVVLTHSPPGSMRSSSFVHGTGSNSYPGERR